MDKYEPLLRNAYRVLVLVMLGIVIYQLDGLPHKLDYMRVTVENGPQNRVPVELPR